jgi:hypothetical protein
MTIPFNDIKIDPKKLKTKLIKKLDDIDIDNIIKKIVIKEINNILDLNHFWYEVTGTNICAYKYQFSKKKEGQICGKPIYSKHKDIKYGSFLCSRHLKTHKVERPRKLKENEINCNAITINNTKCLNSAKLDGYCSQHYKSINKVNIKEIHNLIKNKDKTLKIKPLKEENNKSLPPRSRNNFKNKKNHICSEQTKNIKVYENVFDIKNKLKRKNNKIIKIISSRSKVNNNYYYNSLLNPSQHTLLPPTSITNNYKSLILHTHLQNNIS